MSDLFENHIVGFPTRRLKLSLIIMKKMNDKFQTFYHDKEHDKISHYMKKVQVGKDQEKAQSEKDSHSKYRDGKKLN